MMIRILVFILLCVVPGNIVLERLAFTPQSANTKSVDEKRAADEADILEAVFRYQFSHNDSFMKSSAISYYLSFGGLLNLKGKDVGDEFLNRFAGNTPPVRKSSEANIHVIEGVTDKRTGMKGLIFEVRRIKWVSEDEVRVDGGYYENGTSASDEVYTVKREARKWVVKSAEMLSIA
jgi:hypothetical protein